LAYVISEAIAYQILKKGVKKWQNKSFLDF
jgi:hypothetical protein